MKLFKSMLCASPALFIAASVGNAADLPSMKAAPIQYVRVCDAYGSGFFYIPGADTCLRVGGYLRAEYEYVGGKNVYLPTSTNAGAVTQVAGAQDATGIEIRGRIDVDARTQTAWGTVQTAVWLRGTNLDGMRNSSVTTPGAISAGGFYAPAGNGSTTVTMERAFIRFAGVTAGVSTENFVTLPSYMYGSYPWAIFTSGIKQLAYTATFGGGFSSTLAIESRGDTPYSNGVSNYTYNNRLNNGYNLVGNLRYDGGFGYAQLSGAIGNNSARTNLSSIPNSVTLANAPSYGATSTASTFGSYAIGASTRINLPMIAAGDQLHLNVAYAHGLIGLVGCANQDSCNDAIGHRMLGGVLRADANMIPVSASGAAGSSGYVSYGTTDSFAVGGIYTHYWTATWRSNFAAGYQRIIEPSADSSVGLQLGNSGLVEAGANIVWSPTKNFDIGLEVDYAHIKQSLQNVSSSTVSTAWLSAGEPGLESSNWSGRLRLERQF